MLALCISKWQKKWILICAVVGNIGMLFVFKYLCFFLRNLNDALYGRYEFSIPNIALPIGISFFTFQALSYVIDVYRGNVAVQKNPFYLGLYVSFFPQLIAGPIVRYESIEEQIVGRKETWQKFSAGSCRFIVGLSKKILLSNSMAVIADQIFKFHENGPIPVTLAWLGAIAYTLQILYDFSGYSDMAIGLGLMFGFKFQENFNYPYCSKSISEFWRRWHISLGSWFREYVYFPLGGSRVKNKDIMIRNLFVVWLLTGIWHGAEWTFIFWGLLNFIFILFEKLFDFEKMEIKPVYKHLYCMTAVILGWVLFRSKDLVQAGNYFACMFGFGGAGFWSNYAVMFVREQMVFFCSAILFTMPIARRTNQYLFQERKGTMVFSLCYPMGIMTLLFLCVTYLVKGNYNPFIYFNF